VFTKTHSRPYPEPDESIPRLYPIRLKSI